MKASVRLRSSWGALAITVFVHGAALTACQSRAGREAAAPRGDEHPLVGVAAPEFDLPAQQGAARAKLHPEHGKIELVDFWATWCGPCKQSFPVYQRLSDKHAGKLEIIGLSEDDAPDEIRKFAKHTGVHFVLAWDEGQSVSKQYQPTTMPTSYLIDENGIVRYVHAGFRSGDEISLESAIESLLK